ncbi:hypothetical protein AVEN_65182-1 [Araneus ventricosus]|uniref:Uncharacterized protein n=1 Tax=Araneus ventricosus TaxID=182803 RepID=A0A4Y2AFM4_ARAVE|nr:hypothetical protein AVEN_65182-1 [Araneus ventricosus]
MKNIADIFYNPSSTPDAISQAGEKMFLSHIQNPANGLNLNNYRYAAFPKSSTEIRADLSSTKGAALQHSFSNVSVCSTCHGTCTNGAPLEEEEVFEFDQIVEKYYEIRLRTRVKMGYVYFYGGMLKEEYEEWMSIDKDNPVAATLTDLEIWQTVCEQDQTIMLMIPTGTNVLKKTLK